MTDRRTDGRTDGQNNDSQDRASIAASRGKNPFHRSSSLIPQQVLLQQQKIFEIRCPYTLAKMHISPKILILACGCIFLLYNFAGNFNLYHSTSKSYQITIESREESKTYCARYKKRLIFCLIFWIIRCGVLPLLRRTHQEMR